MSTIEDKIKKLPPHLRREVEDFVEQLLNTCVQREPRKLRLTWAGGLKEFKDKCTSLELERQVMEWWGE